MEHTCRALHHEYYDNTTRSTERTNKPLTHRNQARASHRDPPARDTNAQRDASAFRPENREGSISDTDDPGGVRYRATEHNTVARLHEGPRKSLQSRRSGDRKKNLGSTGYSPPPSFILQKESR
mmetsp:Transcript_24676/g.48399  ORF Transcript_24676/g.48399 Transcript_24676/m.48399 type:complete len:124 (+) Transcript_24676:94-465(+)